MKKEFKDSLKTYYHLVKPGIIYGNAITGSAGFFLGSKGNFSPLLFISLLFGMSLVIASGCVFNNYIDRDIDEKMERTKNRALAKGTISNTSALIYGTLLGILGFGILYFFTNLLTVFVAVFGFVFYVILYGIFKRRSIYGTHVGALSGAVPPVAGYVAASNQFDIAAFLLFLILILWQMSHFYSIGIFRLSDYKKASIPVLPAVKGVRITKIHIFFYTIAFVVATLSLTFFHYTGYIYLIAMSTAGFFWLYQAAKGLRTNEDYVWARKMFRSSLIIILVLSIMMSVDVI